MIIKYNSDSQDSQLMCEQTAGIFSCSWELKVSQNVVASNESFANAILLLEDGIKLEWIKWFLFMVHSKGSFWTLWVWKSSLVYWKCHYLLSCLLAQDVTNQLEFFALGTKVNWRMERWNVSTTRVTWVEQAVRFVNLIQSPLLCTFLSFEHIRTAIYQTLPLAP